MNYNIIVRLDNLARVLAPTQVLRQDIYVIIVIIIIITQVPIVWLAVSQMFDPGFGFYY